MHMQLRVINIPNTRNWLGNLSQGIYRHSNSLFNCWDRRLAVCSTQYCRVQTPRSSTVCALCGVGNCHLPGLSPIGLCQYHGLTWITMWNGTGIDLPASTRSSKTRTNLTRVSNPILSIFKVLTPHTKTPVLFRTKPFKIFVKYFILIFMCVSCHYRQQWDRRNF